MELKQELLAEGAEFTSETDVEVMAHLIARELDETGELPEAVRRAYNRLRGHYAFVAVAADEPGVIVGARKECPLIVGRGDGEQFLASGIPAFLAHTRRRPVHPRRRDRRRPPESVEFFTAAGDARRPRDRAHRLGRRGGREGRLRDVHAQGDPRAGGRRRRDDRRPHGAPRRRRPAGDRRRAAARLPADRDRRLRHLLPRGPDRPLRDRGVGARAGRDGHRVRVPLPQPDRRPRRPRDRHHPVGRDRRHAGRHAARPLARREGARGDQHHGLAGHARRRRRALHPLGPGGLRRRHQDLHGAGRRDVPAGAADGRGARRDVARAPPRAGGADQAAPALDRRDPRRRLRRHRRASPSASRTPRSSSTSAATPACRCASRAR